MARGFGSPAFRPNSHISGCLVWLRADLDYHINPLTGNTVARWADQSGNGHHAVQTHAALKQPLWTDSSGRAALSFDNTDGPRCIRIPTLTYGGATAITGSLVLSDTSSEANTVIMEGAKGAGSIWMVYCNTTDGWVEIRDASATQENGGRFSDTLATTRRIIFTIDRSLPGGGALEVAAWRDGTSVSLTATGNPETDNPTGAFSDVSLSIGARNNGTALGWKGLLHEFVLYSRALNTTEIAQLDAYHQKLWGL